MEVDAFRFSNSVLTNKVRCEPDDVDQNYNAMFNNKILSQHSDCILHVNFLNMFYQQLTPCQNYEYLFHAIRPMKRKFAKWGNRTKDTDVELIQAYYGFSIAKAQAALKILTKEQVISIRKELDIGGV